MIILYWIYIAGKVAPHVDNPYLQYILVIFVAKDITNNCYREVYSWRKEFKMNSVLHITGR